MKLSCNESTSTLLMFILVNFNLNLEEMRESLSEAKVSILTRLQQNTIIVTNMDIDIKRLIVKQVYAFLGDSKGCSKIYRAVTGSIQNTLPALKTESFHKQWHEESAKSKM